MGDLLAWLGEQDALVVAVLLMVLLAAEGSLLIGLFVPGDLAIAVAGTTLEGAGEVAGVLVAGVLGCFLGATGGYLLGRVFGAGLRGGRVGRWVGERRWRRAEAALSGAGGGVLLALAYFLPVVAALTPILAGAFCVPYRHFIRWAMAGGTAWVAFYLVLGSAAGSAAREHQELVVPVMAGLFVVAVIVATLVERAAGSVQAREDQDRESRQG